jgi:hypothetical protein
VREFCRLSPSESLDRPEWCPVCRHAGSVPSCSLRVLRSLRGRAVSPYWFSDSSLTSSDGCQPGGRPSRSSRTSRTGRDREIADCILPWTSRCSRVSPGPNRLAVRRSLSRAPFGGIQLSRGFSPLQRMKQREATCTGFASPGCAAPSGFLSLLALSSSRSRAALFHAATLVGFPLQRFPPPTRRVRLSTPLPLLAFLRFAGVTAGGARPIYPAFAPRSRVSVRRF